MIISDFNLLAEADHIELIYPNNVAGYDYVCFAGGKEIGRLAPNECSAQFLDSIGWGFTADGPSIWRPRIVTAGGDDADD